MFGVCVPTLCVCVMFHCPVLRHAEKRPPSSILPAPRAYMLKHMLRFLVPLKFTYGDVPVQEFLYTQHGGHSGSFVMFLLTKICLRPQRYQVASEVHQKNFRGLFTRFTFVEQDREQHVPDEVQSSAPRQSGMYGKFCNQSMLRLVWLLRDSRGMPSPRPNNAISYHRPHHRTFGVRRVTVDGHAFRDQSKQDSPRSQAFTVYHVTSAACSQSVVHGYTLHLAAIPHNVWQAFTIFSLSFSMRSHMLHVHAQRMMRMTHATMYYVHEYMSQE